MILSLSLVDFRGRFELSSLPDSMGSLLLGSHIALELVLPAFNCCAHAPIIRRDFGYVEKGKRLFGT